MQLVAYQFKATEPIPNRRQFNRALRDALDAGLVDYRRTALPHHFQKGASARYAGEYVDRPGSARQSIKQLLRSMSPEERAAFYEEFGHLDNGKRISPLLSPRVQEALRAVRRARDNRGTRFRNDARTRGERNAGRRAAYRTKKVNKLPLVHTGYLRGQTLTAAAALVGPITARRISIPVPGYLYLSPPGTLDKARALQAIIPAEAERLTKVVDTTLQSSLDHAAAARG